MVTVPPLTRKAKLIETLEYFEGEKKTAKELIKWMSRRWAKTGFHGSKSLGLYLRRYRFERDGSQYLIDQEQIEKRKALGPNREW